MKEYISPAMLPMSSIAEYMDIVENFAKRKENTEDTNNVNGVKSELIAKAATTSEGMLVKDRETVKNALELAGIPAENYITIEGADSLLSDTYQVSVNSGNEIKNLRDELYQLKGELSKLGLIKQSYCYNGFTDAFKEGQEKYLKNSITKTSTDISQSQINHLLVEDNSDFLEGDYIAINANNEIQIVQVQNTTGLDRINLRTIVRGPIPTGTNIYKSYGTYDNGAYVFGEKKDVDISPKEKYIILNDDSQPMILTKNYTSNSGYAAQINIPSTAKGVVRNVGVQAKITGFPGALRCYIIDPLSNVEDVFNMTTINEMKEKNKIIAESNLIYTSQATQSFNDITFEFPNPAIVDKKTYIFLFVQIDADNNNYWELKGLRGETNLDLQTNSKLYNFIEGQGLRAEDGDLFLSVVTSDIVHNKIKYEKKGLYTAKMSLNELTKATRIRVELKVNREGRFKVISNPNTLLPGVEQLLNTYNEDNKSYGTSLFNTGQTIAIGNQITEIGNSRTDNTSFNLSKTTFAPPESPVYRIGYKVQAKAAVKSIDLTDNKNPIKTSNIVSVELPLVAIIQGKESGKEEISSDRLIFETEIKTNESGYVLEQFNEIETQIYWENQSITSIDLNSYPELAGKILDITISTDNTYNKIK